MTITVDEAAKRVAGRGAACAARLARYGITMTMDLERDGDKILAGVTLDSYGWLVLCEMAATYLEVSDMRSELSGAIVGPAITGIQ